MKTKKNTLPKINIKLKTSFQINIYMYTNNLYTLYISPIIHNQIVSISFPTENESDITGRSRNRPVGEPLKHTKNSKWRSFFSS